MSEKLLYHSVEWPLPRTGFWLWFPIHFALFYFDFKKAAREENWLWGWSTGIPFPALRWEAFVTTAEHIQWSLGCLQPGGDGSAHPRRNNPPQHSKLKQAALCCWFSLVSKPTHWKSSSQNASSAAKHSPEPSPPQRTSPDGPVRWECPRCTDLTPLTLKDLNRVTLGTQQEKGDWTLKSTSILLLYSQTKL